ILVYQLLERAIARAAADEAALLAARKQWDLQAGHVHDDDPLFEERAAAFLEWYALDQPGADGRPPAAHMAADAESRAERAALEALAATHRSLFRVREVRAGGLLLDDLWGGASFRTRERRRIAGLERGDLFDARLVADVGSPPDLLLTRTFCF